MSDTRSLQRAFVTDLESSDTDRCFDCRHSAILGYPDATCTCLSIPLEEPMRSRCPGHELPPDELRAELDRLRREREETARAGRDVLAEADYFLETGSAEAKTRLRCALRNLIPLLRDPDAKEQGDG